MPLFDSIKNYTQTVCDQVLWRKAHPVIAEEIENHLIDQRDAYIAAGDSEADATQKAIAQMGDPHVVGSQLDRTHRPKPQWMMFALTAALLIIGLFVFLADGGINQPAATLVSTVVGLGLMIGAYFLDFTLIGKYPRTVYFAILALSIITMLTSPVVNGRLQYASFMPLLFPLGFAAIVYTMKSKGYWGIFLSGFAFLLPALIALLVPATSGLLLFLASGLIILSIAIAKGWFNVKKGRGYLLVLSAVVLIGLLALFFILQYDYRMDRLIAMFNPMSDPDGAGYISIQTRELLHASVFAGHGAAVDASHWIGNNTDYLLTYLIYHTGWLSFILISGALVFFIVRAGVACFKQKSVLALLVSVSVLLTFSLQVIGYVAANFGVVGMAPISLPLISHGNTAMMINLALIGIMLSAFRTGDVAKDDHILRIHSHRFVTWRDRKLIISFGKK